MVILRIYRIGQNESERNVHHRHEESHLDSRAVLHVPEVNLALVGVTHINEGNHPDLVRHQEHVLKVDVMNLNQQTRVI